MYKWEYCQISIALFRDGSGGGTQELLEITLPGARPAGITHPFGSNGLLNQLGSEGWELVDVESGNLYLKRPVKS